MRQDRIQQNLHNVAVSDKLRYLSDFQTELHYQSDYYYKLPYAQEILPLFSISLPTYDMKRISFSLDSGQI